MLTMSYARQLLEMAAETLEGQAAAAASGAKFAATGAFREQKQFLADSLQHKAQVIREALAT